MRTLSKSGYRFQHAARLLGSVRILFRHTQPSDASLAALQHAFETWPDDDPAVRNVLQDRARFIDMTGAGLRGIVPVPVRILFHPFQVRSARRRLTSYEPVIAIARRPWPDRWKALADIDRLYPRPGPPPDGRGFVSRLVDPLPMGFNGVGLTRAAEELASRRIAVAVLAVERVRRAHAGGLPPTLDALVPAVAAAGLEDPFSGMPLVYRRAAADYVIYSVGGNRHDDGGALYGHGSGVTAFVGPASPRDLGIRVPLVPHH